MIEHYPYRFKTKEEFENEFGSHWRELVFLMFPYDMDILLGNEYPFFIEKKDWKGRILNNYLGHHISGDMLVEYKPLVPTYKPKEKIVRSI